MIRKWGLTVIFSLLVWVGAISFFVLFSHQLQLDVNQPNFALFFTILEIGTFILLILTSLIYMRLDKSRFAGVKLAIFGPAIGLFCDTFILWNYDVFFPSLNEVEVIGFSAWMAFAYVLFLFTPLLVSRKRIEQSIREKRGVSYGN